MKHGEPMSPIDLAFAILEKSIMDLGGEPSPPPAMQMDWIDHDIMDFDSETLFCSSVCDVMLWVLCFDLGYEIDAIVRYILLISKDNNTIENHPFLLSSYFSVYPRTRKRAQSQQRGVS